MDSSQMIQLEQRGSSNQQLKQTAITDGRIHGTLNMSAHLISQRNPNSVAQDLSGVNIGGNNFLASSERNMHALDSPNGN
jgi:hypothetical protein